MISVYRSGDYFEAQLLTGLMEQEGLQEGTKQRSEDSQAASTQGRRGDHLYFDVTTTDPLPPECTRSRMNGCSIKACAAIQFATPAKQVNT